MKKQIMDLKQDFWIYAKNIRKTADLEDVYDEWAHSKNINKNEIKYKVLKAHIDNDVNIAFNNKKAIQLSSDEFKELFNNNEQEIAEPITEEPEQLELPDQTETQEQPSSEEEKEDNSLMIDDTGEIVDSKENTNVDDQEQQEQPSDEKTLMYSME